MTINNIKAKSLITIVIVVAFVALLLRIIIANFIVFSITQNESSAQTTLKLISTALENYSKDNQGAFPASLSSLSTTKPAYLDEYYVNQAVIKGYNFSCPRLESTSYVCLAATLKCGITGKNNYSITTGGSLISEECSKRE